MPRQRLRVGGSTAARGIGRLLVGALGIVIIWYGAMLALLALKVDAEFVNRLSGYRDAYDALAGITVSDISGRDRLVVGIASGVAGLIAGTLAWFAFPRPRLARTAVELHSTTLGATTVAARAIERIAESSAGAHRSVLGARARFDDGTIDLAIRARRARDLPATLREVRDETSQSIRRHGLTVERVDVTVISYDRQTRRELA